MKRSIGECAEAAKSRLSFPSEASKGGVGSTRDPQGFDQAEGMAAGQPVPVPSLTARPKRKSMVQGLVLAPEDEVLEAASRGELEVFTPWRMWLAPPRAGLGFRVLYGALGLELRGERRAVW